MKPTREQQAILDAFTAGRHIKVQALAGTGKTTTCRMIAESAPSLRFLYLAFNKRVQVDAAASMPRNVEARTVHSLAYRHKADRDRLNQPRLQSSSLARTLELSGFESSIAGQKKRWTPTWIAGRAVATVRKYCQTYDIDITADHIPWPAGLNEPPTDEWAAAKEQATAVVLDAARQVWADWENPEGIIRHDHQTYLKQWALTQPTLPFDAIFLDEAQDSDGLTIGLVEGASSESQIVLVGDTNQSIYCQPAETTKVRRVTAAPKRGRVAQVEEVPIGEVRAGDQLVSWSLDHRDMNLAGSPVTSVLRFPYSGELVQVSTSDGKLSRYTPKHHVVARFSVGRTTDSVNHGKYIVYMMRRGSQYRVGKAQYWYESQSKLGLSLRCSQEGAYAGWVLSVHDSDADARAAEKELLDEGVPGKCWETPHGGAANETEFWEQVGNNACQGRDVLARHGRLPEFPLWTRGSRLGARQTVVTAAANLLDGMVVLDADRWPSTRERSSTSRSTAATWVPVTVKRVPYDGEIVSLEVADTHTYIADGIVTHNSWRGSVSAMEALPGDEFWLTGSFRFGPEIAAQANKVLIGKLDAPHSVKGLGPAGSTGPVGDADAIISRSNAGAIVAAVEELAKGASVYIEGGAQDLKWFVSAARRLQAGETVDHPELAEFDSWEQLQEYAENDVLGADLALFVDLVDRFTADYLSKMLNSTVVDSAAADVVVGTAHKMKGSEYPVVRLQPGFYDEDSNPPVGSDMSEEWRLIYVAITRGQVHVDASQVAGVGRPAGAKK